MSLVDDLPSGWCSKPPEDLLYDDDDWDADDGDGQWICEQLGLGRGRPIMCHCTDHAYLFEAGVKYYFWYLVSWEVCEIISPKTLSEILKTMKTKGHKAVKTRTLM